MAQLARSHHSFCAPSAAACPGPLCNNCASSARARRQRLAQQEPLRQDAPPIEQTEGLPPVAGAGRGPRHRWWTCAP